MGLFDHKKKILVYDAPMSYGKTNEVIQEINNNPDNFYFVFTPLLSEVSRYIQSCPEIDFAEPSSGKQTKTQSLEYLLEHTDKSVVTSHAMFENLTQKMLKNIAYKTTKGKKILIMDEVLETVRPLQSGVSNEDTKALLKAQFIAVNEDDKRVTWIGKRLERYRDIWTAADNEQLYLIHDKFFVFEIPLRLLELFDKVVILTYMFEGSVMYHYFKYYETPFDYYQIDQRKVDEIMETFRSLITVVDCSCYGYDKGALTKGYYQKHDSIRSELNNCIKNLMDMTDTRLEDTLFTMYSSWKDVDGNMVDTEKWLKTVKIGECSDCSFLDSDDGSEECRHSFLSHTVRATNEYSHKKLMIYCINKHPHQSVATYFSHKGVPMNKDRYALSEMLQWLFRGCVRNRQPMKVAILSDRMQRLFESWLGGDYSGKDSGLDPIKLKRRTQDYQRWIERNPECKCFTFEEYLRFGGRALKKRISMDI
jgi:hypothetical protein